MIGLAVMMILYLLDYTVLARFSKIIAVVLLFACLVTLLGGCQLNGARYFIVLPGGRGISMQTLMLFPYMEQFCINIMDGDIRA